jgi:hypothetical protein
VFSLPCLPRISPSFQSGFASTLLHQVASLATLPLPDLATQHPQTWSDASANQQGLLLGCFQDTAAFPSMHYVCGFCCQNTTIQLNLLPKKKKKKKKKSIWWKIYFFKNKFKSSFETRCRLNLQNYANLPK